MLGAVNSSQVVQSLHCMGAVQVVRHFGGPGRTLEVSDHWMAHCGSVRFNCMLQPDRQESGSELLRTAVLVQLNREKD
jgi:hypothetical protein